MFNITIDKAHPEYHAELKKHTALLEAILTEKKECTRLLESILEKLKEIERNTRFTAENTGECDF